MRLLHQKIDAAASALCRHTVYYTFDFHMNKRHKFSDQLKDILLYKYAGLAVILAPCACVNQLFTRVCL